MGWFGFNGGSQLAAGTFEDVSSVATIFINTNLAACAGVMACAIISRLVTGKTDVIMMLNGALGGLVAITAEPLAPSPILAIVIGAIGGVLVFYGTSLLFKLKIDDVVGAIPVHGLAGIFGTLAVPLSNPEASFGIQLYGILWVNIFVFIIAYIIWYLMKITFGIRISEEAEKLGTDKAEVGVIAYSIRD
jgi:Amt family ammonium transporter